MPQAGALGFRVWAVRRDRDGRLGLFAGGLRLEGRPAEEWTQTTMQAVCLVNDHEAPHAVCRCGLHAWHAVEGALTALGSVSGDWVLGAVRGFGDPLQVHDAMWRSQEAEILALASLGPVADRGELGELAGRFDVPIVPLAELTDFAQRRAQRVGRAQQGEATYIGDLAVGEGGLVELSALSVDDTGYCYLHSEREVSPGDASAIRAAFLSDRLMMYVERRLSGFVVASEHVPLGLGWIATARDGAVEHEHGNPAFAYPVEAMIHPRTRQGRRGADGRPAILANEWCWRLTCLLEPGRSVAVDPANVSSTEDGTHRVSRLYRKASPADNYAILSRDADGNLAVSTDCLIEVTPPADTPREPVLDPSVWGLS